MSRLKRWWLARLGYRSYEFNGLLAALRHDERTSRQVQLANGRWVFAQTGDYIVYDYDGHEFVIDPVQFEQDYEVTEIQTAGVAITYQMLKPRDLEVLAKPYYFTEKGMHSIGWIAFENGVRKEYTQTEFTKRYGAVDHRTKQNLWNSLLNVKATWSRSVTRFLRHPSTKFRQLSSSLTVKRRAFTSTVATLGSKISSVSVTRSMQRFIHWIKRRSS